jgi:hypothetical protein
VVVIEPLFFRSSSDDPPYQSRCKVGAKPVRERFDTEFGTERQQSFYLRVSDVMVTKFMERT